MKSKLLTTCAFAVLCTVLGLAILSACSEKESVAPDVNKIALKACGTCGSFPVCCSSSSDPDGDGWGWENSASCVVNGTNAQKSQCSSVSGGGSSGSVGCPSSLTCPSGISCGCYTVSGLGTNKQALNSAGASRYFLASAMLETELMNTNYTYGDGKTGDSFNAGRTKLNYYEANASGVGQGSTSALWNKCTSPSGDVQVWNACKSHWGSKYWAVHRNGASGNSNPNTQDINNFKAVNDWLDARIGSNSAYSSNDVRFWASLPAI